MKSVAKTISLKQTDMAQFFAWASRRMNDIGDRAVRRGRLTLMMGLYMLGMNYTAHNDIAPRAPADETAIEVAMAHAVPKITAGDTYGQFLSTAHQVTPYLVGFLATTEGFELSPYQDSRGFWTIGIGNRTTPWGGAVGAHTGRLTPAQAYETARWHLEEKETYMVMYAVMCEYCPDLTVGEFLGLASFVYNGGPHMLEPVLPERGVPADVAAANRAANNACSSRWWALRQTFRTQRDALDADTVHELFAKYPVQSFGSVLTALRNGLRGRELANNLANYLRAGKSESAGLVWRRWLEGCLVSGDINPADIAKCPMGGGWAFMKYAQARGQKLIADKKINFDLAPMFIEWVQRPMAYDARSGEFVALGNLQSVESVMPTDVAEVLRSGEINLTRSPQFELYADGNADAPKKKQFKKGGEQIAHAGITTQTPRVDLSHDDRI